jgi:hypothetical protein
MFKTVIVVSVRCKRGYSNLYTIIGLGGSIYSTFINNISKSGVGGYFPTNFLAGSIGCG